MPVRRTANTNRSNTATSPNTKPQKILRFTGDAVSDATIERMVLRANVRHAGGVAQARHRASTYYSPMESTLI
jgi:hypothetical protein